MERLLTPLRAPAQFAAAPFHTDQVLIAPALRLAQTERDEMGRLMGEDPGEFGARAIERDAQLAEKRPRMDRHQADAQARASMQPYRTAPPCGHPPRDRGSAGTMVGFVD